VHSTPFRGALGLLFTCQQIRIEAWDFLYKNRIFDLPTGMILNRISSAFGSEVCRNIRTIKVGENVLFWPDEITFGQSFTSLQKVYVNYYEIGGQNEKQHEERRSLVKGDIQTLFGQQAVEIELIRIGEKPEWEW
jgi:hypothetical protein